MRNTNQSHVLVLVIALILLSAGLGITGTLIEDFDDGDLEGWERSPQNEKSNVIWEVVNGELMFDPNGLPWDQSIGQLNFVGVPEADKWEDYEFQVDIKNTEMANWPGGIRGHVDLDTGSHYAVWLYPGDGRINLYSNPGWDINTGLVNLSQSPYSPKGDEFHTLKLSFSGKTIKVFYDGEEIISKDDSTYPKGTIALCVQDKVVYYDNIQVTGTQVPNINLSAVEPKDKLATVWGKLK